MNRCKLCGKFIVKNNYMCEQHINETIEEIDSIIDSCKKFLSLNPNDAGSHFIISLFHKVINVEYR